MNIATNIHFHYPVSVSTGGNSLEYQLQPQLGCGHEADTTGSIAQTTGQARLTSKTQTQLKQWYA